MDHKHEHPDGKIHDAGSHDGHQQEEHQAQGGPKAGEAAGSGPAVHDHHGAMDNIRAAFFLNLAFTIFEIAGGFWTNSLAILSDALHDFGDSVSLGLSWYFEKYSKKKADEAFSFGYARFSLLGAVVNSLILVGGSVLILTRSIPRIFNPQEVHAQGMLIFAVFGILVNGIAVLRLRRGSSLNEKVVSWHLLEDVLGWIVILVVSIVMMFVDLPILDPILSILLTMFVLYNVVRNLREILNVFLQGVPKGLSVIEMEAVITEESGVVSVHHTHIWTLEGQIHHLSTHIVIPDDTPREDIVAIKQRIKDVVKGRGIEHVTVEVDFESEECTSEFCD